MRIRTESKAMWREWNQKAMTGQISDEDNPAFIFSLVNDKLLKAIVDGEIDAKQIALLTLKSRGYNIR